MTKFNPMMRLAIQTAGERAFSDGLQPPHNPYPQGTNEYSWWREGYEEALEYALAQRHIEGRA